MRTGSAKTKKSDDCPIFVDDGEVQPQPTALGANERAAVRENISLHGHHVVGGCAGFRRDRLIVSHTIGLTEKGLPEIALSGFDAETACILLNLFSTLMVEPIPPGEDAILCESFMNGYPVMARPLPTIEANETIAVRARLYYRRDVPIWQLILSDKEKRWPWEPGVAERYRQGQSPVVDWRLVGPPSE